LIAVVLSLLTKGNYTKEKLTGKEKKKRDSLSRERAPSRVGSRAHILNHDEHHDSQK